MPGPLLADPVAPPAAGPTPPSAAPAARRGPSARAVRNGWLWVLLIPLIGAGVVRTAAAARTPAGRDAIAQATPRALANGVAQAGAAFAVALLLHRHLPRAGLWVAMPAAAAVACGAALGRVLPVGPWAAFALLLSVAALDAIPAALHEAAAVDRAGAGFKFRTVTLPLVLPLLLADLLFLIMTGYCRPVDVRSLAAAHLLLIAATVAGVALARGRR